MSLLETELTGPMAFGAIVGGMFILAGIVATLWRLVQGPTLPDRVVALDLLSMLLTALLTLFAVAVGKPAYLDAALILALVSFLATVAFARYVERRGPRVPPSDRSGERAAKDAGEDADAR